MNESQTPMHDAADKPSSTSFDAITLQLEKLQVWSEAASISEPMLKRGIEILEERITTLLDHGNTSCTDFINSVAEKLNSIAVTLHNKHDNFNLSLTALALCLKIATSPEIREYVNANTQAIQHNALHASFDRIFEPINASINDGNIDHAMRSFTELEDSFGDIPTKVILLGKLSISLLEYAHKISELKEYRLNIFDLYNNGSSYKKALIAVQYSYHTIMNRLDTLIFSDHSDKQKLLTAMSTFGFMVHYAPPSKIDESLEKYKNAFQQIKDKQANPDTAMLIDHLSASNVMVINTSHRIQSTNAGVAREIIFGVICLFGIITVSLTHFTNKKSLSKQRTSYYSRY